MYLGYLLPIIIYSSKINLLTNNYLKAYRKERAMLVINVASFAVSAVVSCLGAFVFDSLETVLIGVVVTLMLSSIASEIVVLKTIRVRMVLPFILEAAMTAGFILCASMLDLWIGCAVYGGALLVYLLLNIRQLSGLLRRFKRS